MINYKLIIWFLYLFTIGSTPCEVKVANGENTVVASDQYTYEEALTPVISSVSPDRGGTGGGTEVTINGNGFK